MSDAASTCENTTLLHKDDGGCQVVVEMEVVESTPDSEPNTPTIRQKGKTVKQDHKTETHTAAESGEVSQLSQLVTHRPQDLAQLDQDGRTPLHLAAKGLNLQCCHVLLQASTREINLKDKLGNSPLLLSVAAGKVSTQISDMLVCNGAKLTFSNKARRTALHLAAESGNIETMKLILHRDQSNLGTQDTEKQTALHLAAKCGNWLVLEELVSAGASMEDKDVRGYTPLHWAAKMGFSICCSRLLELRADIRSVDNKGNTPLHLLCSSRKEKPDCVQVLLTHGSEVNAPNNQGESPFHLCHRSPIEIIKPFLNYEIDLHLIDKKGRTVLHSAAERRNPKYIELVLSLRNITKDIINMADGEGRTALHIAIVNMAEDSCNLLIKTGADGNLSSGVMGTALHLAALKGLDKVCDFLVTKGVRMDIRNTIGLTPLHLAAEAGHSECCQVLTRRGASMAETDAAGMTPLHYASKQARTACCKALIGKQVAHVNKQDKSGRTPLHLAVEAESLACCKALMTPRTDVWCGDHGSPVSSALKQGSSQIFAFLLQGDTSRTEAGKSVTMCKPDIDFPNVLKEALDSGNESVAAAVVESQFWEWSLEPHLTPGDNPVHHRNHNLQRLVHDFPHLARKVMDKCTPPHTGGRYLMRYLDDASPIPAKRGSQDGRASCWDTCTGGSGQSEGKMGVSWAVSAWRHTHLLQYIIRQPRPHLLTHPLVTRWLRHKWCHYGRYIHYASLLPSLFLVIMLLWFWSGTRGWEDITRSIPGKNLTRAWVCPGDGVRMVGEEVERYLKKTGSIVNRLSWALATLGTFTALLHVYRLCKLRKRYFKAENIASLGCVMSSLLSVLPITACSRNTYVREDWQRVAGVTAVVAALVHASLLATFRPWSGRGARLFSLNKICVAATKISIIPLLFLYSYFLDINAGDDNPAHRFFYFVKAVIQVLLLVFSPVFILMGRGDVSTEVDDQTSLDIELVETTLDFDVLFPCLRKKFYVEWISEDDKDLRDERIEHRDNEIDNLMEEMKRTRQDVVMLHTLLLDIKESIDLMKKE